MKMHSENAIYSNKGTHNKKQRLKDKDGKMNI